MKQEQNNLPIAIIGAGPVGLAAAAHLLERGETPLILEAGPEVGHAIRAWGHVRLFSPWRYNLDRASVRLLERHGWQAPDAAVHPTGAELIDRYLAPLARTPELSAQIHLGSKVEAVGREAMDKVKTAGRAERPFRLLVKTDGGHQEFRAKAVIDASGTWFFPNPMGSGGVPAVGEREAGKPLTYGLPDVLGTARPRYAGKTTLVVGAGHSAINSVLDLVELSQTAANTHVLWALRRPLGEKVFGGGDRDALPARGALGSRARSAVEAGKIEILTPYRITEVKKTANGRLAVTGFTESGQRSVEVDEIVVAAGFRPGLEMLREVRLDLDAALESAAALGPLIDPNEHSCGSVRPHGAAELAHPEANFYIVGAKSYGRAPTFLLATGYEQARSVVAALVGDAEAAARVELDLPETGVCSGTGGTGASEAGEVGEEAAGEGCCGGAPTPGADACCRLDEAKKSVGETGCGCGDAENEPKPKPKPAQAPVRREATCCG